MSIGDLINLYKDEEMDIHPEFQRVFRWSEYQKTKLIESIKCGSQQGDLCEPLRYSNVIRSAVLIVHGDKAHSCYFSRDAYANMVKDSKYAANKELLLIPGDSYTDLYDGGRDHVIPFDRLAAFFEENMK